MTGFSTKDPEISALLQRLADATGLTKTTIVKQALIAFEHDEATIKLMQLYRLIYGQPDRQPHTPQEEQR